MPGKLQDLWNILSRSELWVTIAVVLGAIYQANVLPEGIAKIVALALAVLAALGYTAARTTKKIADTKTKIK